MQENEKKRGRPKSKAKKDSILMAARSLFLSKGLDVTTEEICKLANVAKATLYSYFLDKEALLEAVILHESYLTFTESDFTKASCMPIESSLKEFGLKYLRFVNNRELLDWDRLIASTAHLYPQMPSRFFDAGPGRGQRYLIELIQNAIERYELKECDVALAADFINGLWLGFTNVEIRLGVREPLTQDEIESRVSQSIEIFLQSYKF